jgi:hypothetical protein
LKKRDILGMLLLLFMSLEVIGESHAPSSESAPSSPAKSWFLHGVTLSNGKPYFSMNESTPEIVYEHTFSGDGPSPLLGGAELRPNSTSVRFDLDPGYVHGIQILKGNLTVQIEAVSADIIGACCYTYPDTPPPWNVSLNFLLTTDSGRAIASGMTPIVFSRWSGAVPNPNYEFTALVEGIVAIVPIPDPVLLGPNEKAHFSIGLVDLPPGQFVGVSFNSALSRVWSSISFPASITTLTVQVVTSFGLLSNAYRIQGRLEGLNGSIQGANIIVEYAVPGASWSAIGSVRTDASGNYAVRWVPQSTGNFTIRASYNGTAYQEPQQSSANLNVQSLLLGPNALIIIPPMIAVAFVVYMFLKRRKP